MHVSIRLESCLHNIIIVSCIIIYNMEFSKSVVSCMRIIL